MRMKFIRQKNILKCGSRKSTGGNKTSHHLFYAVYPGLGCEGREAQTSLPPASQASQETISPAYPAFITGPPLIRKRTEVV